MYPRKLKVGFTASADMGDLKGKRIGAWAGGPAPSVPRNANGYVERVGGQAGFLGITTAGSGYKTGGTTTYTGVNLFTVTGEGSGAVGIITCNTNGVVTEATLSSFGSGYSIGDVVGVTTADLSNDKFGSGARLTITDVYNFDTAYVTNVQGEVFNGGDWLITYLPDGTTTTLGAGTTVVSSCVVTNDLYKGNVFEVHQYNHGMTADTNRVNITGIEPNSIPMALTADIDSSSTQLVVGAAGTNNFATAEGITTRTGYVQIGSEIIYYDAITTDSLNIGSRGYGGTIQRDHKKGDPVYPYEFNGVSLVGINTSFDMSTNSTLKSLKTIDSYLLEAKRDNRTNLPDRTIGGALLNFTDEGFGGGSNAVASQNFQFDAFTPSFNFLVPDKTEISAQVRTVSGTSDGGSEASFVDKGYEAVVFNQLNRLSTPSLLCSEVDEQLRLSGLPKNKSVTLLTSFNSTDSNVSPQLDLQAGSFRFFRNRLNNPINDYATDSTTKSITGDSHAATYISQVVNLAQVATSLKVIIGAYRGPTSDFRVLYRLLKPDSSEIEQSYELFPGYDNLRDVGIENQVIDTSKNSGRPDSKIPASNNAKEFWDYEFTANNLDEFSGFQIKIVMSGTNESDPPIFKDLRVMALA